MSHRRDDEIRKMIEEFEQEVSPAREEKRQAAVPYDRPLQRPVRLSLPLSRPRAVYALLVVNVLMYGLTLLLTYARSGIGDPPFRDAFSTVLYQLGAKYGPAIDAGQYWRFLTPIVLHGGLIHLGFNSYALYALGPETERLFGTGRFLAIYLLAGLAGTIASYIRSPNLSIGASGAIFGLIGALAAFFYGARSLLGEEQSRQQVTQLITMAAINLLLGLSVATIDNAAHVGGLVAGAAAGFALAPRYWIDDRLYPPAVVRTDRPAMAWLLGGTVLAVLIALAALAVGRS